LSQIIPVNVGSVVILASADPLHPGAVFTTAPRLTITQSTSKAISFTPPNFTSGETVVVLVELYQRNNAWKVRAVGQGYASGLAGLATDYGVNVEDDQQPSPTAPVTGPRPTSTPQPSSCSGRAHNEHHGQMPRLVRGVAPAAPRQAGRTRGVGGPNPLTLSRQKSRSTGSAKIDPRSASSFADDAVISKWNKIVMQALKNALYLLLWE
jgi:hypothetical protein